MEIISKGRRYPLFAGSIPSRRGGRRTLVLSSIDREGVCRTETEDLGAESGHDGPILIVPFCGIDFELNRNDLKEMVAGMRESHKKWRAKQPPPPDFNNILRLAVEIHKHRRNGRRQFALGGIK
ncbi:MAG TPA: hypothetical protein VNA25_19415 [Phycisphaerae bacterium]|nr:hypothetical protein [Phycisphaerae bacterium]